MQQRHSWHQLFYHLVLHTKERAPFITDAFMGDTLCGFMKTKAHELDAWIEVAGFWRDHVHLLLRCGTTRPLCDVYGQLKGFAWAAWKRRFPESPFRWGDGVYIATVAPDNNEALRDYIQNQWNRHESRAIVPAWEHDGEAEKV